MPHKLHQGEHHGRAIEARVVLRDVLQVKIQVAGRSLPHHLAHTEKASCTVTTCMVSLRSGAHEHDAERLGVAQTQANDAN